MLCCNEYCWTQCDGCLEIVVVTTVGRVLWSFSLGWKATMDPPALVTTSMDVCVLWEEKQV